MLHIHNYLLYINPQIGIFACKNLSTIHFAVVTRKTYVTQSYLLTKHIHTYMFFPTLQFECTEVKNNIMVCFNWPLPR